MLSALRDFGAGKCVADMPGVTNATISALSSRGWIRAGVITDAGRQYLVSRGDK